MDGAVPSRFSNGQYFRSPMVRVGRGFVLSLDVRLANQSCRRQLSWRGLLNIARCRSEVVAGVCPMLRSVGVTLSATLMNG
jgi:hypothetical protein